jgi:hypothetical protein
MPEKGSTHEQPDTLVLRGRFERQDGTPIPFAAVHDIFLGDPPSNCGTCFDLEKAQAHTNDSGDFRWVLKDLDRGLAQQGPPGTWKRGCFFVLAVKDARTLGYAIASGEELEASPLNLVALPTTDIRGKVKTESGLPIAGAKVEVYLYLLFVGRGPYPSAPVNFWLSRPIHRRVTSLTATTGQDGEFVISNAPMVPLLCLTASHPDFASLETDYYPYQPPLELGLKAGALVRIKVALTDGSPGVGFDFNLEGVPDGANCATHRDGVTDEVGHCEFRALPPGNYTVRYLGGGKEPWAVTAVPVPDLTLGEQRDILVRAVPGSVLCGRVCEGTSKKPIIHAEVRLESESYPETASTFQATYTDSQGKFTFRFPVAPGPLDVCVSAHHQGKRVGKWHQIVVGPEPRTELVFELSLTEGNAGQPSPDPR